MGLKNGDKEPLREKDTSISALDEMDVIKNAQVENIEFILKIPRSVDPNIAEGISERHQRFVEQELKRFSLGLKDAGRLSYEYRLFSRRPREGERGKK